MSAQDYDNELLHGGAGGEPMSPDGFRAFFCYMLDQIAKGQLTNVGFSLFADGIICIGANVTAPDIGTAQFGGVDILRLGVGPRKITWAAALPTTGTWAVGDVAFNSAPTAGQPAAWSCSVAGTPGTWRPWAALL